MLNSLEIDNKLVNMADAVKAELAYDLSMNVNFSEFYLLNQQKVFLDEQKLNINLYSRFKY